MKGKKNQSVKFIETWAKEKIILLTYTSGCINKILADKNEDISSIWNEGNIEIFENIEALYSFEHFNYADANYTKVKNINVFKAILSECSEIDIILRLVLEEINTNDKMDYSRLAKYEKQINSLVIYASLLLAFYHSYVVRTQRSTTTKQQIRKKHKGLIKQEYIHIINDFKTDRFKKILTEHGAAKLIQERIGMKKDGKTSLVGLTQIKKFLKEEFNAGTINPPWIKKVIKM